MTEQREDTQLLDFTIDMVEDDTSRLWAKMQGEEETRGKAEKQQRKRRSRGTSGGKSRPPGTDTPRTSQMVYQIVDLSTKTQWYVAGLGTTERMVDALKSGGNTLKVYSLTRSGDKMQREQYYQLVLNLTKKRGEPRVEWWPNKYTDKCHFVDNGTRQAGLYRVLHEPQIPGFVSVELVPTDERPDMQPTPVGLSEGGKWAQLEYEHLKAQARTGNKVITYKLEPDQILGALEELLEVTISEDVKRKAVANLAPVEEQDWSLHPQWVEEQDWPEYQLTPTEPVLTDDGEGWLSAARYPFTERQLSTKHW